MNRLLPLAVFCTLSAAAALPDSAMSAPAGFLAPQMESPRQNQEDRSADHYDRGVTHESSGHLEEAVKEYRKALQLSPAHGDARRRLAEIHLLRGEKTAALEQFRELALYQAHNPVIRFRLAQLYEATGNQRKAVAEYRAVTKLMPASLPASRKLAKIYEKRKMHDEAAAEYRRILKHDANDLSARNSLIALYLRGKKYDDLTAFLKERTDLRPDDATGHYKLGLVYEFRKDHEHAAQAYAKAVELDSADTKSLTALARVYRKTGRVDEAQELLAAAVTANPRLKNSPLLMQSMDEEFRPFYTAKKKKHAVRKQKKKSRHAAKKGKKKSRTKSALKKRGNSRNKTKR